MYEKKTGLIGYFASMALVMLLAGCMTTDPVRVQEDFGKTNAQMIHEQTYNKNAAARRESLPLREMDGEMAIRSLDELRNDVKREPDQLNDVINIQLGNN